MKRMLADVCPELINEWSKRNLPLTPDIETSKPNDNILRLKQYLCKKRNIKLVYIAYGRTDEISLLEKIKQVFRSVHIYINSDTEKDAENIKQRFYEWRLRQSQSVIAQK